MELTRFKTHVIGPTAAGDVLFALIDGDNARTGGRCVGLFECRPDEAAALCKDVGSVLKTLQT